MKIRNISLEIMAHLEYLGMTITTIKITFTKKLSAELKSRNAFFYSAENLSFSHGVSKNVNQYNLAIIGLNCTLYLLLPHIKGRI
jgi:hypothetical protein